MNTPKLPLRSAKHGSYLTSTHLKHTWSLSINILCIINQLLAFLASFFPTELNAIKDASPQS
jgi:hypothetical protein